VFPDSVNATTMPSMRANSRLPIDSRKVTLAPPDAHERLEAGDILTLTGTRESVTLARGYLTGSGLVEYRRGGPDGGSVCGVPLPGVPFNDKWGVILNEKGRVDEAGSKLPVLGYTVPYAIGNILLTAWGPVIVMLTR